MLNGQKKVEGIKYQLTSMNMPEAVWLRVISQMAIINVIKSNVYVHI